MNALTRSDTAVLLKRSLRHIARSPDTIVTTAITPIVMLLLFAVAVVPAATTLRHTVLVSSTAVLLFASGLVYMTQLPSIMHWLTTLMGGAL